MKEQVKSFVKKSDFLLKTIRNFRDGKLFQKSYSKSIKGKNNILKIDSSARLSACKINIVGHSNQVNIEAECLLNNVFILQFQKK